MSVLLPEMLAVLRTVKVSAPLFANAVMAEQWYALATRGPFVVHRRTDGRFALCDTRAPMSANPLEVHDAVAPALAALDRVASERRVVA